MVMSTRGGGSSFGLGLGSGVEPIDGRIHEFVSFVITRGILDVTPVTFGTIQEGIMELLDERLGDFLIEIADGQTGV